jgi:glutamyl-tRNA reductase
VEIFLSSAETQDEQKILDIWSAVTGLSKVELSDNVEISFGQEAILHLLRLTSGLDSLVIGEDQILGQVRRSFEFSKCNGHSSSNLSLIFTKALKTGGKVRTTTRLNKGNVSIGSVAVGIAENYFDDLKNRSILIIGSGEGASLVAKSLRQREVRFMITSRTLERAKSFADTAGGYPIAFESALSGLIGYDIVFVSTTAPYFLITYERISKAMLTRNKGMIRRCGESGAARCLRPREAPEGTWGSPSATESGTSSGRHDSPTRGGGPSSSPGNRRRGANTG